MSIKSAFVFVLILLLCVVLIGQEMIARVRGTVRDQQGNPIPKAKITFIYIQQNIRAEVETDEEGEYIRAGLRPGIYKVIVEAEGYSTWTRDDIRIRAGETGIGGVPKLDFILESREKTKEREEAAKAKKNLAIIRKEYKEANEAFSAKDFDTAIEKYKKILELDPNQSSSIYNLAMSYINKKMFKEAVETLKKGVEVQPERAEANFYLAYSMMMADWEKTEETEETEKRMQEAEEYFQKSLELGFDDPDALFSMGAVMANNKREEAALEAFSKAVELKPDFERALIEMATSHVKLANYEKAKELFEQYLKEYPDGEYAPRAEQMLKALIRILEER
jgi:tetratricopeptide (TPR) repeat protein